MELNELNIAQTCASLRRNQKPVPPRKGRHRRMPPKGARTARCQNNLAGCQTLKLLVFEKSDAANALIVRLNRL